MRICPFLESLRTSEARKNFLEVKSVGPSYLEGPLGPDLSNEQTLVVIRRIDQFKRFEMSKSLDFLKIRLEILRFDMEFCPFFE